MTYICQVCNKNYQQSPSQYNRAREHYCSRTCLGVDRRGKKRPEAALFRSNHPGWKGEAIKKYRMLVFSGERILEHRYIMEKFSGRKLDTLEEVHHINGNKIDNRVENLIVLTKSEHARLHARLKRRTHA